MATFDVVIPTSKNIEETHFSICYTLRSILSQSIQPQNIYVVENTPNTGVKEHINLSFGNLVKVIDGIDKPINIAYARNLGAKMSQSDMIVFMDDDVIIGRNDFCQKVIEIMKYNDFCCGAKRFWTTTEWHKYLSLSFQMNHNLQILKNRSFLPLSIERSTGNKNCSEFTYIGNFGAIKKDVFNSMEGFDENYEGWLYQDTDLIMRLCVNDYKYEILAYTDIFCYHLGHPADKQLYRKINKEKYLKKQELLKIKFNNSNFFGRFDSDNVEVITYLE